MSQKTKLSNTGVNAQASPGFPLRWGTSAEAIRRVGRFKDFIQESLRATNNSEGRLGALLVTLDGVLPSSLNPISAQQVLPYAVENDIALEWIGDRPIHIERRLLSFMTLQFWPKNSVCPLQESTSQIACAPNNLSEGLEAFLKGSAAYGRMNSPMKELELDSICWWQEILPNSLFGHCAEIQILSAIPRSAWARKANMLALCESNLPTTNEEDANLDTGAAIDLLDATLVSQGLDSGDAVLKTALDILGTTPSAIDKANKTYWAKEFQKLANRAINAGPRTALLLAWAADMCESGTIAEVNPADRTVKSYISRAILPLLSCLRVLPDDMNSREWSAESLRAQYQILIESQSAGNQSTMRAALSNFHNFLVVWLDFEPMKVPLPGETNTAPVRAQIVWPHELERAMAWLKHHPDKTMGGAVEVILGLASEAPIRAQELMRLRMGSIRFCLDTPIPFAEIDIAHDASSGRLKTPGSQRTMTIYKRVTLQLLRAWMLSRRNDGAPLTAYLFGEPNDDKLRYRPAATLALASQMLKAATGDRLVSLHTLRHTAINQSIEEIWSSVAAVDINRIEVIAAHAGHSSGWTTLTSYSHTYEAGLRMWLNIGLCEQISLDSNVVAPLLGLTAANVRKAASRKSMDSSDYGWRLLLQQPMGLHVAQAAAPFTWHVPQCPAARPSVAKAFTAGVVESMIQNLLQGSSVDVIAPRYGLTTDAFQAALAEVIEQHCQLARKNFQYKTARLATVPTALASSLEILGINFERRNQMKFSTLRLAIDGDVDDQILKHGVRSWENCFEGTYISLSDTNAALGLLSLLKHAGVDSNALRICCQDSAADEKHIHHSKYSSVSGLKSTVDFGSAILQRKISAAFVAIFGVQTEIFPVKFNRGRPNVYLQWDSNNEEHDKSASKGSTAGLNAMMVCIQLYLAIKEQTK